MAVAALLAALHLRYPLSEDSALFMYVAREFADGARMYREFWDMKQPGIYWWYQATGSLLGFDALGLRWMDLGWAVVVSGILWAAVRSRGLLIAILAPCLVFGDFYAHTSPWHLSQVEWLVGGPIALVLWCVQDAGPGPRARPVAWRYLVAGAMVAVVSVFKSMVALLPLAIMATAVVHDGWRGGQAWRSLLKQRVLPAVAGCILVLLPLAAWMAFEGTLREALWTAFVYPPQAVREYQANAWFQLAHSVKWFLMGTLALLPWTIWGVYNGLRRGSRLELLAIAWGAAALVIICMQVLSYWEYHFDLLFMPVGVLAALGFGDALDRFQAGGRPGWRTAAVAVMVLGVVAMIGWPLVRKTTQVMAAMPFTPERQFAFNASLDERWAQYRKSVDAVKGMAGPQDRVIIWGDPRLYFIIGRRPVVEVDGATFYLTSQLEGVVDTIRRVRPALIFIAGYRDRMTLHGGGILPRTLEELYQPVYKDESGVWWRARSAAGH